MVDDGGSNRVIGCALGALLAGLLWVVLVAVMRWVLQLPPEAVARFVAAGGLIAGTAIVVVALAQMEMTLPEYRERRRRRP